MKNLGMAENKAIQNASFKYTNNNIVLFKIKCFCDVPLYTG